MLEEPSYVQSDFQFLPEKTKPVKGWKDIVIFLVLNKPQLSILCK